MAGIRQHILPKQLLKGFSNEAAGKIPKVWVYKKPDKIFETSITNISVEKNFYGKEGELSADSCITSLEGSFGTLLDELRTNEIDNEVYNEVLPILVTHLSIRTKNLRENFRKDIDFILEKLAEFLKDPLNAKNFVLNNNKYLRSSIYAELDRYPFFRQLPDAQKKDFSQEIENHLPMLLKDKWEILSGLFTEIIINTLRTNLPQMIKEGHIKSLSKDPSATPRIEDYREFHWFIYKSAKPVILGDFGCLFETNGSKRFKTITFKDDKILNVILPISSDRILVGSSQPSPPTLNPTNINLEIARCCMEYFVCSNSLPELNSLLSAIGTNSDLISRGELNEIVNDFG